MDYSNDDNESWDWQGEDIYLEKDTSLDHSLWDGIDQNEGDLSYMFDETTPVKACGDLAYSVSDTWNSANKEADDYRESHSQVKRRRMLQFNTQDADSFLCNEQMPCSFANAKDREDPVVEVLPENVKWNARYSGGRSASGSGDFDQSSEVWLPNPLNEGEMHLNSDDMNASGVSDEHIDISDFCNTPHEMETDAMQICSSPAPQIIFKGRKSFIRTPTKLVTSVAYPFALIKPCGVHGDVTLKDINQKILTPPPSKSKNGKDSPAPSYPTSAFSGKPVVVKTKIRTEGGKGSITIMRTKG